MHTPILTANDCEGAGEMFQVTTLIDQNAKRSSIPVKKEIKDKKEVDTDEIDYQ